MSNHLAIVEAAREIGHWAEQLLNDTYVDLDSETLGLVVADVAGIRFQLAAIDKIIVSEYMKLAQKAAGA